MEKSLGGNTGESVSVHWSSNFPVIGTALSFTTSGESGCGVIFPLVEVIHLPYCQLLVQFGSIEQQVLLNELGSLQMVCFHLSFLLLHCIYLLRTFSLTSPTLSSSSLSPSFS